MSSGKEKEIGDMNQKDSAKNGSPVSRLSRSVGPSLGAAVAPPEADVDSPETEAGSPEVEAGDVFGAFPSRKINKSMHEKIPFR